MDDLPTGFRFYPTEEELVSFYLHNKLNASRPEIDRIIPLLDIYHYNPSDLPQLGGEYSPADAEQWFFFIPRQEREARGGRPNRLTDRGYWKATGSPTNVYSSENRVIGRKRTMVFYVGRAPNGRRTVWKMNEYKAIQTGNQIHPQIREQITLCRIYKTSKCLRAFDRRTTSMMTVMRRRQTQHPTLINT
ncbi:NAC domain-containing protein 90-like isoform X2 [Sesamum indicum]|uniref:NAC domain-containing protein 90-like isoform X2 n=1 Tax=Sesamum indicum TaxID=4182 RepID=A0A8M8VBI3_SESIN|nr:NAC domain-containing protein 90-like isoform X2 [Sesamum indicum]